eukprot:gene301-390_t
MISLLTVSLSDSLASNYASLPWISPALWMVGAMLMNLILQVIFPEKPVSARLQQLITMIGLMGALVTSIGIRQRIMEAMVFCNQLLQLTPVSANIHLLLIGFTMGMVVIFSLLPRHEMNTSRGTYLPMMLAMLLGGYWLTIACHWLLVYLSMAILTMASGVLIYHPGNSLSSRASVRYVMYGMVFSSIMLVGLSYLYGSTGTLWLGKGMFAMREGISPVWGVVGGVLVLSGLMMILGSFPFQLWVVRVYEHTSFTTIAYLSTLPKIAAIYFLVALHHFVEQSAPAAVAALWKDGWTYMAIFTLCIGNIGALAANNVKHILAYGSIVQTGFLLVFVILDTSHVSPLITYYMVVYSVMNVASWLGLQYLNDCTPSLLLKAYAGIGKQIPLVGICFLIVMVALIGLPPTAGFSIKLLLLNQLWQEVIAVQGKVLTSLFVGMILSSLFSLYYYLKIPYFLFFKSAKVHDLPLRGSLWLIILLLVLSLVGLFFIQPLFH